MNHGGLYIAIYDLSADRERTRVARVLEGYGTRIQKSAFELRLSRGVRARLLVQLEALALASGWVALYQLDESARRHTVGAIPPNPLAEELHACIL